MATSSGSMKAVIYKEYGPPDVLQTGEVPKPVPGAKEICVKVHAGTVNYGDLTARNFKAISLREFNMPMLFWLMAKLFFGLRRPKKGILGSEFSGVVESVGSEVTAFKTGEAVFGYLGQNMGAYAEYVCIPEKGAVAPKPENMSFEEAAASSYGSVMALHLIKKAGVQPDQRVLIIGASGSIGAAAVQVAKHMGANVTGICGTPGTDYVKSLGADRAIDYSKEDFTTRGETYDLIFDILGRSSFKACKNSLNRNGRYFRVSFKIKQLLQMLITSFSGGKRVVCAIAPGSREDLMAVKELIEAGRIKTLIDKSFPIEQAAAAHKYVESGHKQGSVVLIRQ